MQGMQEQGLPHNDYDQLYGARVEIIPCEPKLPGITTRDPAQKPASFAVLDEVPADAKEDCNVKLEANKSGRPLLKFVV
jgi:hypothetical protein